MKYAKVLKWTKYLLPLFVATIIWLLIYINSFFNELPSITWYAIVWLLITFFLQWKSIELITDRLEAKVGWHQPLKRVLYQLFFTVFIGVFIFDLTFILMNWIENEFIGYNNPLSLYHILAMSVYGIIVVLFISVLQLGLIFRTNWKALYLEAQKLKLKPNHTNREPFKNKESLYLQRFVVKKGIRTHMLSVDEIMYFEKDELVFAITYKNERFIIDHSLKELMELIDPLRFFRISRQHIINLAAIKEWTVLKNNLIIGLNELPNTKLKVSQRNISQFKAWASELEV